MYTIICWPEIQELMDSEGFEENSYLINDDKGISDFGSSAYFVNVDWLNKINNTEKKKVWHNSNEELPDGKRIIVYYSDEDTEYGGIGMTFNNNLIYKWAYLNELQ